MIHFKKIIVVLIVMAMPALAMIELSALKNEYVQYEPVALSFELYGTLQSEDYFGTLEDMGSFYELEIQYENESSYIYHSPIRGEGDDTEAIDSVLYSTIIKSDENIITAKPGYYRFQLRNKNGGAYVSNPLVLYVREPMTIEEESQLAKIKQSKKEYAQYIFLEGGEHNSKGHELFKSLAENQGTYGHLAKGYLALNYSQDFLDIKGNGKRKRLRDLDASDRYLAQIEGSSRETLVTMKAVRNFLMHSKGKAVSPKIKKLLTRIRSNAGVSNTRKSRLYKKLFK